MSNLIWLFINCLLTCNGPPLSPWQESWPPVSWPAHKNISGMNSCRPARRNMVLHRSLLTMGTDTSCNTDGKVPPSLSRPHPVTISQKIKTTPVVCYLKSAWLHHLHPHPGSLNFHDLPVAFWPIRRSSVPGKQIGAICGANSNGASNFTSAKSYSYVKKLYFGWTIFFETARSM